MTDRTTPQYRFEAIPRGDSVWMAVRDERNEKLSKHVSNEVQAAEEWASRQIGFYKLDPLQVSAEIRKAFAAIGKPVRFRFHAIANVAHPETGKPLVACVITPEGDGTQLANFNSDDRDRIKEWAAKITTEYPLNSVQVEQQLDAAFAALRAEGYPVKPNPTIDAEFQVIDDGGTAFPCSHGTENFGPGISARDLFAAFSLMGQRAGDVTRNYTGSEATAEQAYEDADAMLAQRSKRA